METKKKTVQKKKQKSQLSPTNYNTLCVTVNKCKS